MWESALHNVIMGTMASQITSLTIVYSTVYSGADQRKYQGSASLAFVTGESPHKWPVTRKNNSIWWCHHGRGCLLINSSTNIAAYVWNRKHVNVICRSTTRTAPVNILFRGKWPMYSRKEGVFIRRRKCDKMTEFLDKISTFRCIYLWWSYIYSKIFRMNVHIIPYDIIKMIFNSNNDLNVSCTMYQ